MRTTLTWVVGLALATACSDEPAANGACSGNDSCAAGEVCVYGTCRRLCRVDGDCNVDQICRDTLCVTGGRTDAPQISEIDGTGSDETLTGDSRGTATAHHLQARLLVRGQNLEGAAVWMVPASGPRLELAVESTSATEIAARIPETANEGQYVLQATNAAGADQAEVWLLRGEQGEPQTGAGVLTLLQGLGDPVPGLNAARAQRADSLSDGGASHTYAEMSTEMVPPGAVTMFAMNACPTGWIPADGAVADRSAYPRLFAAIGTTFGAGDGTSTFGKPDLRGEFLRGWDSSRGVDTSRAFGTAQGSATRVLMNSWFSAANGHPSGAGDAGHGLIGHDPGIQWVGIDYQASGPSTFTVKRSLSPVMDSNYGNAGETRPRNVALLACIKI